MNKTLLQILPYREVVRLTSLSKVTIYRGVRAGIFPKPIKISARRIGWRSDDIDQFIAGNGCREVQP